MNVYKTTIDLMVRCLAVVILLVTVTGQGCPDPSHTCYDSDGFPIPCETKELKITPYMGANQVSGTLEEGAALV
ncbi:MAG: hypothetical protein JSV03_08710, partial [Planctomycetota bacterium]